MPLSSETRSPLYHQIYLILRSRILDGEYAPGDYLPGERELEEMFQVSRITAVRALNDLAAQGLVVRERGRGTRVQLVSRGIIVRGPASERLEDEGSPGTSDGERSGMFDAHRKSSTVTLHEFGYVKAKRPVAEALKLAEGDVVQHSVRTWQAKGEKPFNYLVTYVPEEIGRLWSKADLEKHRLGKLLARHGIHIAQVQEQVTATLADIQLAQRLQVAAGSPILKIRRIAFDDGGRPIEFVTAFFPPDRYHYEVTLMRKGEPRWESQ
jgi:GntR family transcriptional regulator